MLQVFNSAADSRLVSDSNKNITDYDFNVSLSTDLTTRTGCNLKLREKREATD